MDIFPLVDENGQLYHPVRQAAALAKYSRSPESARVLIHQTPELAAEKFQERVIVNWGHDSVAELATLPVCFEGVSIVASKVLEAMARPGCSEKSTRMQKFTRDQVYFPTAELETEFSPLVDDLFELYEEVLAWAIETNPTGVSGENTSHRTVQTNIEKAAFDLARCILPAGVRTNLALVAYPRDLAHLIRSLGAARNPEFVQIATEMRSALAKIGGPLIRHTEPQEWLQRWRVRRVPMPYKFEHGQPGARLVGFHGSDAALQLELNLTYEQGTKQIEEAMADRPFKAEVPDVFRLLRTHFDVLMDYGAFRDLQRHRRMNQFVEPLTTRYGYIIPEPLKGTIWQGKFQMVMHAVEHALAFDCPFEHQVLLQYVTPMAFLHRSTFDMDLQQLYYLTELRTQPAGHIAYRRIAWQMAAQAREQFPWAMQWCRAINPNRDTIPMPKDGNEVHVSGASESA